MIYWTIIIGKSEITANSPTQNHQEDYLNKLTETRTSAACEDSDAASELEMILMYNLDQNSLIS